MFESVKYPINKVTYFDELGNKKSIDGKIERIKEIDGKKYLILESDIAIKLDLIYSVDHEISPNYADGYFNCDCV